MAKNPDAATDEMAKAIAYTLSEWAGVEEALLLLFTRISGIEPLPKAVAAFGAIVSFETRLDVCDALMPFSGESVDNVEVWSKLSAKLTKFHRRRHPLAHFAFITSHKGRDEGPPLVSTHMTPFWPSDFNKPPLDLAEINLRREKFRELREAVIWFWNRAIHRWLGDDSLLSPPSLVQYIQTTIAQKRETPPSTASKS